MTATNPLDSSFSSSTIQLNFRIYPDPSLTPGVIDPRITQDVTATTICRHGYTATVRHVTSAMKKAVFLRYFLSYQPKGYEVDHLISLELGGSNDIMNLWPQPYCPLDPRDPSCLGAREKDRVENVLHRWVCDGTMLLGDAQRIIVEDWVECYRALQGGQRCQ